MNIIIIIILIIIIMYENTKPIKLLTILIFIQDCNMLIKLIRFNIHVKLSPNIVYSFKNIV